MDFPDKTEKLTPPDKNITPVVSGAKRVERPATRKVFDFLFAESPRDLLTQVGRDVVAPRLKAGLEEALNSFISGMLWGGASNRSIPGLVTRPTRGGGVAYSAVSSGMSNLAIAQSAHSPAKESSGNYRDIVVPTQQYAESLLAGLYELWNQYRVVTVADLYELADISPQPSDNSYGWTNLDGVRISKVREGFTLELPRPTLVQ